jgi:protein-disulfide isomerase
MAAGRSLTPFYAALAMIVVAGAFLISRSTGRRGGLSLSPTAAMPPIAGPRGVAMGSDSAPIEVAEYSDFECPYCARFAVLQLPDIEQRLIATGRVRWRFMHFPLDGHEKSPQAHLAAACGNEQGKFWLMHDAIYQGQADWASDRRPGRVLRDIAQRVGLDLGRYDSCVREQRAWNSVLADRRLGDSLGVGATPTIFINGHRLQDVPTFDELRHLVDSIAPQAGTVPPPAAAARR